MPPAVCPPIRGRSPRGPEIRSSRLSAWQPPCNCAVPLARPSRACDSLRRQRPGPPRPAPGRTGGGKTRCCWWMSARGRTPLVPCPRHCRGGRRSTAKPQSRCVGLELGSWEPSGLRVRGIPRLGTMLRVDTQHTTREREVGPEPRAGLWCSGVVTSATTVPWCLPAAAADAAVACCAVLCRSGTPTCWPRWLTRTAGGAKRRSSSASAAATRGGQQAVGRAQRGGVRRPRVVCARSACVPFIPREEGHCRTVPKHAPCVAIWRNTVRSSTGLQLPTYSVFCALACPPASAGLWRSTLRVSRQRRCGTWRPACRPRQPSWCVPAQRRAMRGGQGAQGRPAGATGRWLERHGRREGFAQYCKRETGVDGRREADVERSLFPVLCRRGVGALPAWYRGAAVPGVGVHLAAGSTSRLGPPPASGLLCDAHARALSPCAAVP